MMQLQVESECRPFVLADIDILASFPRKSFSFEKTWKLLHEINK